MSFEIVPPKLFNEDGSDSFEAQALIGGNPTGIANLNNQRYSWVRPIMREMLGNFWVPEKVGLDDDKPSLAQLTEDEDWSNRHTYSSLVFLDNYQIGNLPKIADVITNPGVRNLMVVQEFQEVIHSESYQYGLLSFYPSTERDSIYNLWRESEPLRQRNKAIALIGEEFQQEKSPESLMKVVVANLALEGIYFYGGFNFYDVLAHRGKLVQWNKIIDYIRRDEFTHMGIFCNIIKELKIPENIVYEIVEHAVNNESAWQKYAYGNRILGVTEKSSEDYAKWLGNDRLIRAGYAPLWENVKNPYQAILESKKAGGSRVNFFETVVTEYDTAASVDGWEDF